MSQVKNNSPDKSDPAGSRRLALLKKLLFSLVTVLCFFGLLEFALAVCQVETTANRDDPYVGFSSYMPLFIEQQEDNGELLTAPNKLFLFNDQQFSKKKPADTVRIFCVGGSTTYGRPYHDPTSFCGWLREFLAEADTSRRYEVVNAGGISYASYRVARVMEELVEYEPDLFIIYTGHNEFLERRTYDSIINTPEWIRQIDALLSRTRTYALFRKLTNRLKKSGIKEPSKPNNKQRPNPAAELAGFQMPAEVTAKLDSVIGLEAYERDPKLRKNIVEHFRFNLRRMISMAREAGSEVMLVTPASKLADCAPFKSQHRSDLTEAEIRRADNQFRAAQEDYTAGRFSEALKAAEQGLKIDNQFAAGHFVRGQALRALGRFKEARPALVRARETDVCPLRALSRMQQIVRNVAAESQVPVVDFVKMVDDRSPNRIPGKKMFLDHVHPTIEGHRILALALIDQMAASGTVRFDKSWGEETIDIITEDLLDQIDLATHAAALRNLSKVLSWAGKLDEADELALDAVALNPDDSQSQYQAGNAMFRRGKLNAALNHFELARDLNPASAENYYGLGLVCSNLGRLTESIKHYSVAVTLNPDYADAYFNLALLLERKGELKKASRNYEEVVRIFPGDADALNNLGVVYGDLKKFKKAIDCFLKAVKNRPEFPDAHANLGRAYLRDGQRKNAIRSSNEALRQDPNSKFAVETLREAAKKK